jgi:hypothetical protein
MSPGLRRTLGNCDPAVIRHPARTGRRTGIVFGFWSGARDLNPGPHGPELCDIPFRNGGNDRFLSEFVTKPHDREVFLALFVR